MKQRFLTLALAASSLLQAQAVTPGKSQTLTSRREIAGSVWEEEDHQQEEGAGDHPPHENRSLVAKYK
jgi:hypothetical protein